MEMLSNAVFIFYLWPPVLRSIHYAQVSGYISTLLEDFGGNIKRNR